MRRRGLQPQIEILELKRGPEVLAKLEIVGDEYPWWFANIYPTPAFETVRGLFREQSDDEKTSIVREQLRGQQITVRVPDHHVIEFTLIVDGSRARLRSDKIE